MTEIRIPFTKTKIEKQGTQPQHSVKWIDLEINTNFLMSQIEPNLDKLHGGSPDGPLARMRLVFFDDAEPALYQNLLSKSNFELSFDLAKVAYEVGGGVGHVDNTRPTVSLYQHPDSRLLEVHFKPQFAGVIKLVESTQTPPIPNPSPQPGSGTPPPPPNSTSIQLTLKNVKVASGLTEPGARAVEMEVESFILNFPRYGDKTFKKVVVIDNKNQNRDKLDLLLNSTNTNIEISFLNNAKIDKWKHKEGGSISEQPNVTWKDGHEEELNIYLNDIFGFKPDQIEFKKSNQTPPPGPNGPSSPPQKNPPPKNPPTNDRDQEIRQLKARIKELEEKLRQNPNSPTAQDDRATLDKLKKELNQKEKGHNPSQSNSDQFPYLLVFGIGAVAVFLMVAIYLMVRSRRHQKS